MAFPILIQWMSLANTLLAFPTLCYSYPQCLTFILSLKEHG
jgi:hypothetical protein